MIEMARLAARFVTALSCAIAPLMACGEDVDSGSTVRNAVSHELVVFRETEFDVVTVDLSRVDIELFWKDDDGRAIRGLRALENHVKRNGETLLFATNAGIYSKDFTPAGLHVENGKEAHKINLREGGGNFHLMPNGVFYIDDAGAHVVETRVYVDSDPTPTIAAQSGPMLVIDGELHPRFREESDSVYVRSGVGVQSPGTVIFALSRSPVNLHTFALLFQDRLECPNALYLDGKISRFYMPGKLEDSGPAVYVGMIGVTAPKADAVEKTSANRSP